MAKNDEDVVFRRIRGRVVPIKVKRASSTPKGKAVSGRARERFKAAGFITTGLAASIFGGTIAGQSLKKGFAGKQMAFKFGRERAPFGRGAEGAMFGAEIFQKSKNKIRFGKKSAFVAQLLGGAFIGEGFTKLAEEAGIKRSDATNITAGAAGEVAAFATGAATQKALRGTSFRKSTRKGLDKLARFVLRKKLKL